MKNTLYIGIDAGVHTGIAVWDQTDQQLVSVDTMTITKAMDVVRGLAESADIVVYLEDARERKWFGCAGREKLQGAGSVKRDCSIWETFCEELGIKCQKIAPKNNYTKLTAKQFKAFTNWAGRTSEHSRDAAMLVFGRLYETY
jgi:D-serine dehydratase